MYRKVFISGVSGFIGRTLGSYLCNRNYTVYGLSRDPQKTSDETDKRIQLLPWLGDDENWIHDIDQSSVFIHLAGSNISTHRWSDRIKNQIRSSRVLTGKYLVQLFKQNNKYPGLFLQASAIGYYGNVSEGLVDESSPKGAGFLADTSSEWENSTKELENAGIKRHVLRIGMVLGRDGGALPKLVLPQKYFLGAYFGSGSQGISWIHLNDLAGVIGHLIENESELSIFNLTAPKPVSNKNFCKIVGKVIKRPCLFKLPAKILEIILGEMGRELILNGAFVHPQAVLKTGYEFKYPELYDALSNLLLKS
ncbi:MAG: TIGR01777 family oxidoreductase [Calditrichaceae bacterium]|nr:TIGR01777 family oxidoreductase [Calditrichaceae bacterium]MBN2708763.1 TIGR01777 family oxidoreductase [Calditrichaceae bacterium]RQV97130.1 MAG: TIGR01777 family protein [Calditrichota bacterium]